MVCTDTSSLDNTIRLINDADLLHRINSLSGYERTVGFRLSCSFCPEHIEDLNSYRLLRNAARDGWQVVRDNVVCPTCYSEK